MTHLSIQHLLREHRQIERISAELESLLASQKAEPQWAAVHALAFSRIVCSFTECVIPHMRKEDELLFPILEAFLPRDVGPLAVLRGELRDLRTQLSRVREAGEALCRGDTQPQVREDFQHFGHAIIQSLTNHIYKEERVLFPMVARSLPSDWDAHLLHQMETMTAETPTPRPTDQDP